MRAVAVLLAMLAVPGTLDAQADQKGEVTMPLDAWDEMNAALSADKETLPSPYAAAHIERRVEGRFEKGLFRGTLVDRFEVQETEGYVQVPILDAEVSLGRVTLFGKGTSLFKQDDMYVLGVDKPGIYEVKLEFFAGEDNDRFARGLSFRLPDGGVTSVSVVVPETDIEPRFEAGVMTKKEARGAETLVEGRLDASGTVALTWTRKLTHRTDQSVSLEAAVYTVFTVEEAVVSGRSVFDFTVREGETDALAALLPEGVEVVKVEGETVLQWAQDSGADGRLTVLLRHLVTDRVQFTVHFQMPLDVAGPVVLRMPLPMCTFAASVGVQGPLGYNIQVAEMSDATEVPVRDLPAELTALTERPILLGFAFTKAPKVAITVTKHAEIALTGTVIEELQASTVQIADGARITKLKLRIRNNTRQNMAVTFPEGAELTHAFVEGSAVRPAVPSGGPKNVLLFPLRQSERLVEGEPRIHVVRPGETFSDIANFYFSDPTKWKDLFADNPDAASGRLYPGQTLLIPAQKGAKFEESTFVLELAYREQKDSLGLGGTLGMTLPSMDVDVMSVLWHVYLPEELDALRIASNLVQYSAVRYDPFRRVQDYLEQAMRVRSAWAGGDYENILKSRKAIFAVESEDQTGGGTVRSTFPLVGRLYKFKRVLLGQDTPRVSLLYVDKTFNTAAGMLALGVGFLAAWLMLRRSRDLRAWALFAAAAVVMLVLAHYFIGMHRKLLWGADLALLVTFVRERGRAVFEAVKDRLFAPWRLLCLFTLRNVLFLIGMLFVTAVMLAFPLFVSTVTFAAMLFVLRQRRAAALEVTHG